MDKCSELLDYQNKRIDGSLDVPLTELFEARSRGTVFQGQYHSCAMFIEQGLCHTHSLSEMTDHILTLAALKKHSSALPMLNLQHFG